MRNLAALWGRSKGKANGQHCSVTGMFFMNKIVQFLVSAFSLTKGNLVLTLTIDQMINKNLTFDLVYWIIDKIQLELNRSRTRENMQHYLNFIHGSRTLKSFCHKNWQWINLPKPTINHKVTIYCSELGFFWVYPLDLICRFKRVLHTSSILLHRTANCEKSKTVCGSVNTAEHPGHLGTTQKTPRKSSQPLFPHLGDQKLRDAIPTSVWWVNIVLPWQMHLIDLSSHMTSALLRIAATLGKTGLKHFSNSLMFQSLLLFARPT